jgi:hypothetical protein
MIGCWLAGKLNAQNDPWYDFATEVTQAAIPEATLMTTEQCGDKPCRRTMAAHFHQQVGQYVHQCITNLLGEESLAKCGYLWRERFCNPVARFLLRWCNNWENDLDLDNVLLILNLYRCYVESDFASPYQKVWAQPNFGNVTRCVHEWLSKLIAALPEDHPTYRFVAGSVANWKRPPLSWTDTVFGRSVRPIGYYQIDLEVLDTPGREEDCVNSLALLVKRKKQELCTLRSQPRRSSRKSSGDDFGRRDLSTDRRSN